MNPQRQDRRHALVIAVIWLVASIVIATGYVLSYLHDHLEG